MASISKTIEMELAGFEVYKKIQRQKVNAVLFVNSNGTLGDEPAPSTQHPASSTPDINCKNCAYPLDVEKPKCECCGSINLLYKSAQPKIEIKRERPYCGEPTLNITPTGYCTGLPNRPTYAIPDECIKILQDLKVSTETKQKLQILIDHRKELVQAMMQKPKRSASFGIKLRKSKTMEFLANLVFGILSK